MLSKAKIKLIRSLELKKNRKALGLFVAEGPKVVGDLMDVMHPDIIVALPEWLEDNTVPANTEVYDVSPDELRHISFLQHPQQVLAVFKIPHTPYLTATTSLPQREKAEGEAVVEKALSLALDNVQDPGNLGTIIRIADWFGIENIYCSPDTADAWNPKVVQATMGSIARVKLTYCDLSKLLDSLPSNFPIYGTLLDGDNINEANLVNRGLIIMGNEGNGISPEIASRVTHRLLIPNYPEGRKTADSLNVAIATAITCFAIRKA